MPTLLGETGIAMDLMGKAAFRPRDAASATRAGGAGDWSLHIAALDNVMRALEINLLAFTLWNYSPQNSNAHGDEWNDEDLSLWSSDQLPAEGPHPKDPFAGGRALQAAVRPYARKVSGTPVSADFDLASRRFRLTIETSMAWAVPTEVFVPTLHYPGGVGVEVTSGHYEYDSKQQVLRWWHSHPEGFATAIQHRLLLVDPRTI